MSSIFTELKRRNVFRVAMAYLVISWLVLQIANTLIPLLELPSSVSKTILLILLLGFIPAVFFSWAFEITPEGIKKEKDVIRDDSITNITAKKLDYITLMAAIGLVGMFVSQKLQPPSNVNPAPDTVIPVTSEINNGNPNDMDSRLHGNDNVIDGNVIESTNEKSIAVLPFADMSQAGDQEYFADGISEEILNALVKASGLRVAGRTSSFSFKGKDSTIKQIGTALNVAHVLEGSVRKQGNKVRITAQLIKTDDEFHMWSETYDGSLDNIFDLQENISRQVTEELKIILKLNEDERLANKMTDNIDAYDLFLRGREAVGKRVNGELEKGMDLLQEAIKLDPNFAEAWAVYAEAKIVSSGYLALTATEQDATTQLAKEYAQRALAIDSQLALPHAVIGMVSMDHDNLLQAIDEIKKALSLEPNNALFMRWLANVYAITGRVDLAMPLYEKAYLLDPLSTVNAYNLAASHFKLTNIEETMRFFRITGDLRGSLMPQISFVYAFQGKDEAAREWLRAFIKNEFAKGNKEDFVSEADIETFIVGMLGGTGPEKTAARELGTILSKGSDNRAAWQLEHHLALGNIDRVYEILEEKPVFFGTFANDFMWLPSHGTKAFRADPRFIQLVQKHNLPQAWQEIGWPDLCKPFAGTDGSDGQFSCE